MTLTTAQRLPRTDRRFGTAADTATTIRLLAGGIAAGPLFLAAGLAQAFTREGFDFDRHALSLLSLGTLGFIQIANFLVSGALLVAAGAGLRRAMTAGPGRSWGPRLIAGFGIGMIIAGLFRADPSYGFPVGAPAGPADMTWHSTLHAVGFAVATLSWIAATVVLSRRFTALGERTWAAGCVAALLAAAVIGMSPLAGSIGVRLVLASAIQFAAVAAVSAKLIHQTRSAS